MWSRALELSLSSVKFRIYLFGLAFAKLIILINYFWRYFGHLINNADK